MPSDLYLDRVEFQLELDRRWPRGGWLEVMAVGELPYGPSMVSTGIFAAVGRVLCMEVKPTEDPDIPNLFRLMFDFKSRPLEIWEEVRPWTCWTDGRFTRVANRPDVWRWPVLDDFGDEDGMVCYFDAAPTGDRQVTEGHRRMSNERLAELFPEGLVLERNGGDDG